MWEMKLPWYHPLSIIIWGWILLTSPIFWAVFIVGFLIFGMGYHMGQK